MQTEKENSILSQISDRFSEADAAQAAVAERRIFLSVPPERFPDILRFAAEELGFDHLCTITGLDTGDGYEFIYHIADQNGIVLNLKFLPGGGDGVVIPSVLPVYQGATFYERELESLLGVTVDGLPEGRQYPLPDNWPKGQYPMRKDWKPPVRNV